MGYSTQSSTNHSTAHPNVKSWRSTSFASRPPSRGEREEQGLRARSSFGPHGQRAVDAATRPSPHTVVDREPRLVYISATRAVCQSNGTITGGTDFHGHEQRRPELDRQLHLGHRRRRPPRPLRPRQVPRCHPADDRAAPAGRGAGGQQAERARHEGGARPGRHRRAGFGPAAGGGPGLLQHLEVHPARPARPRQPAATQGRLRGPPRRLLAERAGHPRELRVPQPDSAALEGRRPRHAAREAHRARRQPQPRPGEERRRLRPTSRPRQPRHGLYLRGAGPPLQRGEQRGGGRALDAARRRPTDGEARLPARRRGNQVRNLPALRRAPAAPAAC